MKILDDEDRKVIASLAKRCESGEVRRDQDFTAMCHWFPLVVAELEAQKHHQQPLPQMCQHVRPNLN